MENTLNIQIKVTDEQMSSLLKGKLESLPDDKVQEIFSNALSEFLKTRDGQKLFYTTNSWGVDAKPTRLLISMVENAVSKEMLKPCVDEFIAVLKDNYVDLIKTTMVKVFSNMFFSEMQQQHLEITLNNIVDKLDTKADKL